MTGKVVNIFVITLAILLTASACSDSTTAEPEPLVAPVGKPTIAPTTTEPFVAFGTELVAGEPYLIRIGTHCGTEWLGEWNRIVWHNPAPTPDAWWAFIGKQEVLDVVAELHDGPNPSMEATANGVIVIYLPSDQPMPGCD